MAPRRAPKRAVWRRHRVWPWALAAAVLALGAGGELARRSISRRALPPLDVSLTSAPRGAETPAGTSLLEGTVVTAEGAPAGSAHLQLAPADAEDAWAEACPGGETTLLLCEQPAAAVRFEELLREAPLPSAVSADTDATGHFRFQGLKPAVYRLVALSPGGWALAERAPAGVPLTLTLRPYRTLVGRVLDEGGEPLAEAFVRLLPQGLFPLREARTGKDGAFALGEAGPAPFALLASAPGFLPGLVHPASPEEVGTVTLARARSLQVHLAGDVPQGVTVRVRTSDALLQAGMGSMHLVGEAPVLQREASLKDLPAGEVEVDAVGPAVRGGPVRVRLKESSTQLGLPLSPASFPKVTVVDTAGRPVRDCVLEVRLPGIHAQRTGAEACEDVELEPVLPGVYLLSAEAPGYRRSERAVQLVAGVQSERLVLSEALTLGGHVLDAAGWPVPGMSVVVSPINAVTRTDREGAFRVSLPSAGLYSVEAQHSVWGGAEVQSAAPDGDLLLRLKPRAVLELSVREGERPLEGAVAVLQDVQDSGAGGQYQADRATDADGHVRLAGFPPGTYSLGVAGRRAPVSRQEVLLREGVTSVSVRLPAVAEKTRAAGAAARASILPESVVRGRVLDEAGVPLRAFRVDSVAVSSDDGRFSVSLPVRGGGVAFSIEAPPLASARVVRPASQPDVGDVVLRRASSLKGTVQDAEGRPVADALVVCEGCRGEDVRGDDRHLSALSDTAGHFTLPITVAHGQRFRLVAMREDSLGWAEAGRVGQEALLTLAAPSVVRGRVLGPDGHPSPGVAVAFSEPLLDTRILVTAKDGTFSGPVAPGLYQVTVAPDGSQPRRTWTVQVPADRPLELGTAGPGH
jgi:protocatechuate 3,4-dioxygenase beta subunit